MKKLCSKFASELIAGLKETLAFIEGKKTGGKVSYVKDGKVIEINSKLK